MEITACPGCLHFRMRSPGSDSPACGLHGFNFRPMGQPGKARVSEADVEINEAVKALARKYPEVEVTPTVTWHGNRVCAVRRDHAAGYGLTLIGAPDEVDAALADAGAERK